jgi:hypothetical protein
MKTPTDLLAFTLLSIGSACGPELSNDEPDPEQIITAFCDNLFRCPDTITMLGYGSVEECETIHRGDYEMRDSTCRDRVLRLEECLSELTCEELDVDRPCSDEGAFLTDRCHPL